MIVSCYRKKIKALCPFEIMQMESNQTAEGHGEPPCTQTQPTCTEPYRVNRPTYLQVRWF